MVLVEKGRLITSTAAHLISIEDIDSLNSDDDESAYYIEAILQFVYELKDGGKTQETFNVGMDVEIIYDDIYSIEEAYRIDEDEIESEN